MIRTADGRLDGRWLLTSDKMKIHTGVLNAENIATKYFGIDKVIFNDPATIVYWTDGEKTVVKCGENDVFDAEKGFALCFMKKALCNRGNYNNVLKKYVEPYYDNLPDYSELNIPDIIRQAMSNAGDVLKKLSELTES